MEPQSPPLPILTGWSNAAGLLADEAKQSREAGRDPAAAAKILYRDKTAFFEILNQPPGFR